jgi:hypothetical protein
MSVFRITLLIEEVDPSDAVLGKALEELEIEVGLVSGEWNDDTKNVVGHMLDDVAYRLKNAGEDDEL